jgi:hypothetical protein
MRFSGILSPRGIASSNWPLDIPLEILDGSSRPDLGTITGQAGTEHCTAQVAHHGYFRYHAFDIARYPVILNEWFCAGLRKDFTHWASPTASVN